MEEPTGREARLAAAVRNAYVMQLLSEKRPSTGHGEVRIASSVIVLAEMSRLALGGTLTTMELKSALSDADPTKPESVINSRRVNADELLTASGLVLELVGKGRNGTHVLCLTDASRFGVKNLDEAQARVSVPAHLLPNVRVFGWTFNPGDLSLTPPNPMKLTEERIEAIKSIYMSRDARRTTKKASSPPVEKGVVGRAPERGVGGSEKRVQIKRDPKIRKIAPLGMPGRPLEILQETDVRIGFKLWREIAEQCDKIGDKIGDFVLVGYCLRDNVVHRAAWVLRAHLDGLE